MKKKYKLRKGTSLKVTDAQVVGETLEQLRSTHGKSDTAFGKVEHFKTESVVLAASSPKSPLHKYFEWNNTKASDQWRLQQARNLVSSIVEVTYVGGEPVEQRSFLSVHDEDQAGKMVTVFVTLKDAIENDDYRKQLLNKAITTLENLTITMKMFREYDK